MALPMCIRPLLSHTISYFLSISSAIAFCCVCFFPCFATFFWLSRSLASTDSLGLSLSFSYEHCSSVHQSCCNYSSAISALRRYSPLSAIAASLQLWFLFCCSGDCCIWLDCICDYFFTVVFAVPVLCYLLLHKFWMLCLALHRPL